MVVFFFYMRALARLGHDRYRGARMQIAAGMVVITAAAQRRSISCEGVSAAAAGADRCRRLSRCQARRRAISRSAARTSRRDWRALFGTYPVLHMQPGDKLYLYSAVFAPHGLHHPHRA